MPFTHSAPAMLARQTSTMRIQLESSRDSESSQNEPPIVGAVRRRHIERTTATILMKIDSIENGLYDYLIPLTALLVIFSAFSYLYQNAGEKLRRQANFCTDIIEPYLWRWFLSFLALIDVVFWLRFKPIFFNDYDQILKRSLNYFGYMFQGLNFTIFLAEVYVMYAFIRSYSQINRQCQEAIMREGSQLFWWSIEANFIDVVVSGGILCVIVFAIFGCAWVFCCCGIVTFFQREDGLARPLLRTRGDVLV